MDVSSSSPSSNNPDSSRHAYDQQIPTEQNKEQTQRMIEKQDQVPGETRDDEIVTNFPEAASNGKNSDERGISSRQEQNNTICTKTTRIQSRMPI